MLKRIVERDLVPFGVSDIQKITPSGMATDFEYLSWSIEIVKSGPKPLSTKGFSLSDVSRIL